MDHLLNVFNFRPFSKYAVDAFTSSTFSTLVSDQNEDIRHFHKSELVSAMIKLLNPTAKFAIPMLLPKGGELFDVLGFTIFDTQAQSYFQSFTQSLIDQRLQSGQGRKHDLLGLMCK